MVLFRKSHFLKILIESDLRVGEFWRKSYLCSLKVANAVILVCAGEEVCEPAGSGLKLSGVGAKHLLVLVSGFLDLLHDLL